MAARVSLAPRAMAPLCVGWCHLHVHPPYVWPPMAMHRFCEFCDPLVIIRLNMVIPMVIIRTAGTGITGPAHAGLPYPRKPGFGTIPGDSRAPRPTSADAPPGVRRLVRIDFQFAGGVRRASYHQNGLFTLSQSSLMVKVYDPQLTVSRDV